MTSSRRAAQASSQNRSDVSPGAISPPQNIINRVPRSHSTRNSFGSANFRESSSTVRSSSSLPSQSRTWINEWKAVATEVKEPAKSVLPKDRGSADPPRPAHQGCEWVWFPEGYWAEREVFATSQPIKPSSKQRSKLIWRRRSRGTGNGGRMSAKDSGDNSPVQEGISSNNSQTDSPAAKHRTFQPSPKASEASNTATTGTDHSKLVRGFMQMSPTYPHFISPSGEPEGLYCKTKRGFGVGLLDKRKKVNQMLKCVKPTKDNSGIRCGLRSLSPSVSISNDSDT